MTPKHGKWTWRKSSFSSATNNCVEIGRGPNGQIGVRDSKNPYGPSLRGCNVPSLIKMAAGRTS
jgi:hypothetical protein